MIETLLAATLGGVLSIAGLLAYFLWRWQQVSARRLNYQREQYNALVDIAKSARKSIPINRL